LIGGRLSARRIRGAARRHWWTLRRSWPRIFDVFFWPTVEVIVWGLVTVYLVQQVGAQISPAFFLGGMILWVVLYRAQEDLAVSVLEESWSDNAINLFGSPLRPVEYLAGAMLVGLFKTLLSAAAMALLAWTLYGYNLLALGPTLLPAIVALVLSGWTLGLLAVGLILRYGRRVDVLAWSFSHLVQPLACAVYPVKVLPPALQVVAGFLPPAHAFEATRAAVVGDLAAGELALAVVGSVITLGLAAVFCQAGLERAREIGRLASLGE
jgi:ABC-2 type transport system permease protein